VTRRFAVLVLLMLGAGCAHASAVRPFGDALLVREDPDLDDWGPRPEPRRSTATWDAAEGLFFRAQLRTLAVEAPRQSVDVNALDEVPRSSFFVDRIGALPMTPEQVARGACADGVGGAPPTPWTVVAVKPDGVQPGFVFEDAAGQRHLLKVDGALQRERSTAADAIVAALLHAAGYHTPCNRVVRFSADDLAVTEGGPTRAQLAPVLAAATRGADGRLRAMTSELFDGAPLGPWRYTDVWEPDRNDRVPHELRRELRGLRLFFAWVDHLDARAQNTLAYWVGDPADGHVRHALLDFGDSLGATHREERRSLRYGAAMWSDPTATLEDLLTLGLAPRAWYREPVAVDAILGDYGTEPFDPDAWRPNYWNGAFEHMDATDAAWAARIIARFDREHLEALAARGRFSDPEVTESLVDALARRRLAILRAHLTRRSPLTAPAVRDGLLCLEDRAVSSGLRAAPRRWDHAAARTGRGQPVRVGPVARREAEVCVALPRTPAPYLVVDVRSRTPSLDDPGPARVHLRPLDGGWRVVGLERPPREEAW